MEVIVEEDTKPKPQTVTRRRTRKQITINSVRLNKIYFVPWILAPIVSLVGIVYNWYFIEDECWEDSGKEATIMFSIALFAVNIIILKISCLNSCILGINGKIGTIRLYVLNFAIISLISIFNLVIAIFTFMQKTCYFSLRVPEHRISDDNSVLTTFFIKYDTKLSGICHLLVAVFGFLVAMPFARIRNNYKYVKQIDFE